LSFRTVIIEHPSRCSYQGGYLIVRQEEGASKIHLSEISSITLGTNQVFLSAYLLSELAKNKISLVVTDEKHNPIGQYLPLYGAHNTSKRIAEQLEWGAPIKKRVWQHVIKDKIRQQARLLEERGSEVEAKRLYESAREVRSGDTTNREAQAARIYFSGLFGEEFNRDFPCPLNGALNYGYAVLLSMVNREIVSRGYLTQCGINHRNEYNQFNLACDLMEPFRPAVDEIVYDNFVEELDEEMRLALSDLPNKGVSYRGGSYRLSSVVALYIQDCLNALNKVIDVDDIEDFEIL
jgi:CRISPR-associated protein Cas1